MNVEILFGATIAIIPIALTVLASSWKTLTDMIASLPEGHRKVIFNLNGIKDRKHQYKAELVMYQCFGCISYILSIIFALFSILLTASNFVGYNLDFHFYQQQDYSAGKVSLFISIFLLLGGFYFIGVNYGLRLLALLNGRPDPLSVNTSDIPIVSERKAEEKTIFQKHLFYAFLICMVVFGVLISWDYFAQWFDSIIALLIAGGYSLMWLRKHRKSKQVIIINQPVLLPPVIDNKPENISK